MKFASQDQDCEKSRESKSLDNATVFTIYSEREFTKFPHCATQHWKNEKFSLTRKKIVKSTL